LELIFNAPPSLDIEDFQSVELNKVPAIVVPPETKLENLATDNAHRAVVLLYAHGGGYLFGEPLMYLDSYKRWVREAEANGIRLIVVSVDYRRFQELYLILKCYGYPQ
jgi:acetyl esterase/lipase